jgi:hypothetical protein
MGTKYSLKDFWSDWETGFPALIVFSVKVFAFFGIMVYWVDYFILRFPLYCNILGL